MIFKVQFPAMGSEVTALLDCPEGRQDILGRMPAWFDYWENILSRFRPESELSRLNRSTGQPTRVSQVLWEVLMRGLDAEMETGGLVTPGVLSALNSLGYDQSFDQINDHPDVTDHLFFPIAPVSSQIVLDDVSHMVTIPPSLQIDLGGFGKGWAAHQASKILSREGPALVDAGGDIAISAPLADGSLWLVGVEDPFDHFHERAQVELGNCGMTTSGRDRRRWVSAGREVHHILDPRSGAPADGDVISATVIAPDVMKAEMASKMIVILGSGPGLEWLAGHPGFEALVINRDGEEFRTAGFSQYERCAECL